MMGKGSQRRKVDPLLSSNHSLNEMLILWKLFFGKDENYLINTLNEMLIDGMKW